MHLPFHVAQPSLPTTPGQTQPLPVLALTTPRSRSFEIY
jgi:hypothetical protein